MFEGFASISSDLGGIRIHARWSGTGPPLLLLHGFPETHVMWRDIAPRLTARWTVVCADLRGYGESDCPAISPCGDTYSKRTLATDMVRLMQALGFERFCVAGHDRGGRVAQRMALDMPDRVRALAVLDVIPIAEAWDRADDRMVLAFWPWSLLAQPAPLPESVLTRCADEIVANAAAGWGSARAITPEAAALYAAQLRDPLHAQAICEEYRAAASIDREHDRQDWLASRRINCPTLALWSASGPLSTWYEAQGGPLGIWRSWCDHVTGRPMTGGHFFPEEDPRATADALAAFFARAGP